MRKRYQQILKTALPTIVTNITVPLLGLVDTTWYRPLSIGKDA